MSLAQLCQKLGRILYPLVGPDWATKLASSSLGQKIGNLLTPKYDAVYSCDFGIRLKMSPEDAKSSGLVYMGQLCPLETEVVRSYTKKGDILFQVGCFKDGWFSLVAAPIIGEKGKIFCFEPIPEYATALRENVALNHSDRIVVEELAITDKSGCAEFSINSYCSSMFHSAEMKTIAVKTQSLDGYVKQAGINHIDFLIVDVEGAEFLLLKGGESVIRETVNYAIIEIIDANLRQAGTSAEEVIGFMQNMGFTSYVFSRHGLKTWKPGVPSETFNMFFSKTLLPVI